MFSPFLLNNGGAIIISAPGAKMAFNGGFEQDSGSTSLTVGNTTMTVSGGDLVETGGQITCHAGTSISVTGKYRQTGGTTTAYSAYITVTDQILLSGGSMLFQASTLTATNGMQISSGAILQGGGTVNVASSTLTNAGTINPGTVASADDIGHIAVTGNYTQTSSGILNMDAGGSGSTNVWDTLDVSALATLSGTINVLTPGSIPNAGAFELVSYGSRSGTFTTVNPPPPPPMGQWDGLTMTRRSHTGSFSRSLIGSAGSTRWRPRSDPQSPRASDVALGRRDGRMPSKGVGCIYAAAARTINPGSTEPQIPHNRQSPFLSTIFNQFWHFARPVGFPRPYTSCTF